MYGAQEAEGKEGDEEAAEAIQQARIIAYSDSDSDDPQMPSLPFRRRKADGGETDSDNNADSSDGAPEKKGLSPWRGWGRPEKSSQVESFTTSMACSCSLTVSFSILASESTDNWLQASSTL